MSTFVDLRPVSALSVLFHGEFYFNGSMLDAAGQLLHNSCRSLLTDATSHFATLRQVGQEGDTFHSFVSHLLGRSRRNELTFILLGDDLPN
jgi:hypothetical protein